MIPKRLSLATAVLFLLLLAIASIAAPLLTATEPDRQHDPAAGRLLPPGAIRYEIQLTDGRRLLAERFTRTSSGLSVTRNGHSLQVGWRDLDHKAPIKRLVFPLGTDHLGRDCLSRLLYGGRLSLTIGALATLASAFIGSLVGSLAATAPVAADALLMRMTDCALAFPPLVALLLFLSLFEGGFTSTLVFLAVVGWMPFARIVRAELLSIRPSAFVEAAVVLGQTRGRIFVLHLLPHLAPAIAVAATLRFAEVILLESSLAFLGLGIPAPAASWGRMIADGANRLETAWWLSLFPGAILFATVVSITTLGDWLVNRLDSQTRAKAATRW